MLEAGLAGHGPSGRNGGFVSTLWDDLPILRDRVGDTRAVEVCRASERAVHGIGAWCDAEGRRRVVSRRRDALRRDLATRRSATGTSSSTACAAVGAPDEARRSSPRARSAARCASPLFRGGGLLLPTAANVHPARLALGLRAKVIAGRRPPARAHARRAARRATRRSEPTPAAHGQAGAAVLAVNSATPPFAGYRLALGVASSHMVITEPVPDVLEEIGWTGGEAIADCRTLLHYLRTTRDGRIALGWGGGRMGFGGRHTSTLDLDRRAVATAEDRPARDVPSARERSRSPTPGAARSTSPPPTCRSSAREGRIHHGFGFTGNGVGPSFLGGEILARLALDRRDELTGLAIVDPERKLMPPEPLRWAGGSAIRAALVRRDAAYDRGREPDPAHRLRRLPAPPPRPSAPALTPARPLPRSSSSCRPSRARSCPSGIARIDVLGCAFREIALAHPPIDGRRTLRRDRAPRPARSCDAAISSISATYRPDLAAMLWSSRGALSTRSG